MTALLDTSVLVRYLTLEPAWQGELARALIEGEEALVVSAVALAETAWALTRRYGIARDAAVDMLIEVVEYENVSVLERSKGLAVQALLQCRGSSRTSFADALIWAAARSSNAAVYTFDQRFPTAGIERRVLGRQATG